MASLKKFIVELREDFIGNVLRIDKTSFENIQQIQKLTEKKLNSIPLVYIRRNENSYAIGFNGKLKGLNLDVRRIKDVSFLSSLSLSGLTHLLLTFNQITDFTPLSTLTNLTVLGLSGYQFKDLSPLSTLTNLNIKELYLINNQIEDITPLGGLKNLTVLDVRGNQILDLSPLSQLTKLESLLLDNNQIMDLSPLSQLTKLESLLLDNNKIMELTPLRELKQLSILEIRNNRLQRLSSDITSWWPKMNFYPFYDHLSNNPLKDPPIEIVKQGKAAIENYFAEIQQAPVHFLESKILLVGSGDVGKTTLMKKLKDKKFKVVPDKEDTTRGIDIQPWQLSCPFPDGILRDVKIHFWDFGGQDILHATHQFFLTKRSLYLFVWDPRKGGETRDFDYWLNAVKLLGAGSPLIMVMNKADIYIKLIDELSFQGKFSNIAQFRQISCFNGQQMPELIEDIRHALGQMPHLLDKLPKRWKDIRDEIKIRKDDYITRGEYFAVCRNHGMDEEKALFLSDYLHDLGIILHFQHDPVLSGTVILKPEWATGAVYALIDSLEIQKNSGRFNGANLGCYWDKKKYPADKHSQLLRLIEKFELCFNIVGTYEYILPELLPVQCHAIETDIYRSPGNLQLHYSYDFMPAGIITRFISRLYYLVRDGHYWNNGVELAFSGSLALVVSDTAQRRIRVTVTGTNNTQLMGIIRSNFDHIHETLNMKKEEHFFEEVPCICPKCSTLEKPHLFKYNVLQKLMAIGKDIICEKSFKDVSPTLLLNGFLLPKEPEDLFNSLVTIASQIQEIKTTLQTDENSRNTVVSLLLQTRGFIAKDQTLSGLSASGHRLGELDTKIIHRETGRTLSIIEALNLYCCDTTKINRHVLKLLQKYDLSGLKANYILVYVSVNNFPELCCKYREHLRQIDYNYYPLKKKIEEVPTGFNKIKAFRALHKCLDGETSLYHLLVEM